MRSQSKLNELASKLGDIEVRSKQGESRSPAPAKPPTPGGGISPRMAPTPPGPATAGVATSVAL